LIRKDAANGDGLPKWRFIQEVPWKKRPQGKDLTEGKVESIPSLSITFGDSCAPSPSVLMRQRQRFHSANRKKYKTLGNWVYRSSGLSRPEKHRGGCA
jgi:hypothetical protein